MASRSVVTLLDWALEPIEGSRRLPWAVQAALLLAVVVVYAAVRVNPLFEGAPEPLAGFIGCHLTDVLAPIAFFSACNLVYIPFGRRLRGRSCVLISTAVAAVVWEGLAPLVYERSVADPLDVVAYACGAVLYLAVGCR